MIPTRVRRFRVTHASEADSKWLEALVNREGERFSTAATQNADNILTLCWDRNVEHRRCADRLA